MQPTMFDHIGFGRFDSRIIPFTFAYGLSALLLSVGDLMDFVEKNVSLNIARGCIGCKNPCVVRPIAT
jgi:hypothetical protein